jgi:hypothetical protein
MITMYDALNPGNIPASARVVGGYPDRWAREGWDRFPGAVKVLIAESLDPAGLWRHCNVFGTEAGALTPAQVRECLEYRQGLGKHGNTVYCSADILKEVQEACHGLDYWLWLADWLGQPEDLERAALVQYRGNVAPGYDLSAVFSAQWLEEIDEANRPWPLAA